MQIMERRFPFPHEFLANAHREWKVRKTFSVKMPDLSIADVEEHHTVRVRVYADVRPRAHFTLNSGDYGLPNHRFKDSAGG